MIYNAEFNDVSYLLPSSLFAGMRVKKMPELQGQGDVIDRQRVSSTRRQRGQSRDWEFPEDSHKHSRFIIAVLICRHACLDIGTCYIIYDLDAHLTKRNLTVCHFM